MEAAPAVVVVLLLVVAVCLYLIAREKVGNFGKALLLLLVLGGGAYVYSDYKDRKRKEADKPTEATTAFDRYIEKLDREQAERERKASQPPEWLTAEKYDRLEEGMKYSSVVVLLGREGRVTGERKTKFGDDYIYVRNYEWKSGVMGGEPKFRAILCTFTDGQLVYKRQVGLY